METNKPSTTQVEDEQARILAMNAAAQLTAAVIGYDEYLGGRSKAIRRSIYPTMMNTVIGVLNQFNIDHGLGEIKAGGFVFKKGKRFVLIRV